MRPTRIRDNKMDERINKAEQLLNFCEKALNYGGEYSRSLVYDDLEKRKAMDRLSTMGSSGRQTYKLSEKKQVYAHDFNNFENTINPCLDFLRKNHPSQRDLISRLENCLKQISELKDFVRDF